jgi:hypothetical protein
MRSTRSSPSHHCYGPSWEKKFLQPGCKPCICSPALILTTRLFPNLRAPKSRSPRIPVFHRLQLKSLRSALHSCRRTHAQAPPLLHSWPLPLVPAPALHLQRRRRDALPRALPLRPHRAQDRCQASSTRRLQRLQSIWPGENLFLYYAYRESQSNAFEPKPMERKGCGGCQDFIALRLGRGRCGSDLGGAANDWVCMPAAGNFFPCGVWPKT